MSTATALNLHHLDGKIVLVKSSRDHRNPQAAIRGTIVVRDDRGAAPRVSIEFDVPQMFRKTAHHRTLHVERADVMRLIESEHNGVFEYTTDELLD
jgi:hypothetical protein